MKKKMRIGLIVILSLFVLIMEEFLFGALLPYSPVFIGFHKVENDKVSIYYHKNLYLDIDEVSKIIAESEDFHTLTYTKRINIILTESEKEFYRYTFSTFRFLAVKNKIFVSGRNIQDSQNGKIHMYAYLKHELSHLLIYQNMSPINYFRNTVPGWLLEGIATYHSGMIGQDSYYSKDEVYKTIQNGIFLNPIDWKSGFLVSQSSIVKEFPLSGNDKYFFIYSELGCVIEDLIQRFGHDSFIKYMKLSMKNGDNESIFYKFFGIEYKDYIKQFQEMVLTS
ncbi:hypothetical protein [Sediminispirochaeta bajacaliforniensis]|uniref:hypothetical protein n=1 Tax=Sediminispirochaeta bajacaliforniensis TaxID=148 RepID=UPI00037B4231|nr:hypothetical protein [Sediminispirochaeta bajacaliforniensis]